MTWFQLELTHTPAAVNTQWSSSFTTTPLRQPIKRLFKFMHLIGEI